jgi:hypothetical protein
VAKTDEAEFTVYEAQVGHDLIFARSKAEIVAPYGWEYVTKECVSSARCLSLGDSQNKTNMRRAEEKQIATGKLRSLWVPPARKRAGD